MVNLILINNRAKAEKLYSNHYWKYSNAIKGGKKTYTEGKSEIVGRGNKKGIDCKIVYKNNRNYKKEEALWYYGNIYIIRRNYSIILYIA